MKMELLFSATSLLLVALSNAKILKMVHLVYRHGARSPVTNYTNDKYQFKDWPDGPGRLTQKGMDMEYKLGKFLRKRYIKDTKFLNETYLHGEVRIRSSDKERCLQSAQAQLAGLYPPKGYQIWNKDIHWQPIPVHTVEKHEDVALRAVDIKCPRLDQKWDEWLLRPDVEKKLAESKELFKKLSDYSGIDVTWDKVYWIFDPTMAEITEGWPIPDALIELWPEITGFNYWLFDSRFKGDDELGRLTGGTLLGTINKNMKSEKQHHDNLHKMNIYSAHDTTLLSLSTALDTPIHFPNFSACIMVELYEENNQHLVEMYYRNDFTDVITALKLENCSHSCPLDEFLKLTKPRTTEDRSKICVKQGESLVTIFNLEVLVMGLSGFSFLLLLLLLLVTRGSIAERGKYKTLKELHIDGKSEHCAI